MVRITTIGQEKKARSCTAFDFSLDSSPFMCPLKTIHLFELHGDEPREYILVHSEPELNQKQLHRHCTGDMVRPGEGRYRVKTSRPSGLLKLVDLLPKVPFTHVSSYSWFDIYTCGCTILEPARCYGGRGIKTFPLQLITDSLSYTFF